MKSLIKYFFSIYLIVIIVVLLTIQAVQVSIPSVFSGIKVQDYNNWISFAGSILGALISGVVTFLVVRKTIKNDRLTHESNRRDNVRPFLHYSILDDDEEDSRHIIGKFKVGDFKESIDLIVQLKIENIGMNSAIEFNIYEIDLGCKYDPQISCKVIKKDDWGLLKLPIIIPHNMNYDEENNPIKDKINLIVFVNYRDLLNNFYHQKINLILNRTLYTERDENENIITSRFEYNKVEIKAEAPILTDENKLKLKKYDTTIEVVKIIK